MKTNLSLMLTALAFVAVSVGAFSAQAASSCADKVGTCEYYSCLSKDLGCQADDYTDKLAAPYCHAFMGDLDNYSDKGQAFVVRVESCLQHKIEKKFDSQTTCEELGDNARQQHAKCYAESGFCGLPLADKARVAHLVMGFFIQSIGDSASTAVELGKLCGEKLF